MTTPLAFGKAPPSRSHLAAALLLCALPAVAHAAGKRVGVPKFDGPQEAIVRKHIMQSLKAHDYQLVKSRAMEAALQSTGALLESDDGFEKVAKELALSVIVTGEVGKKRAKIFVHDGHDGSLLGDATFKGANPKKIAVEVGRTFWSQLGAQIGRGTAPSGAKKTQKPAAEAPEDDENAPDENAPDTNASADTGPGEESSAPATSKSKKKAKKVSGEEGAASEGEAGPSEPSSNEEKSKEKSEGASEEAETAGGVVPPTLDVTAGFGGINRSFSYHQSLTPLRSYSLPLGAAAALQVVWYPIALLTDGAIQNLGVQIGLEQAFGIQSKVDRGDILFPNGATFGTTVHEFEGGVRYRVPFGTMGNQSWLGVSGGEQAFIFKTTNTANPRRSLDIPDTVYQYARVGLGVRLELPSNFAVSAAAGYRIVLNHAGPHIKEYFPHSTVGGVDAEVYLGYRVTPLIEIRAGGEIRRYFYSMHSIAADRTKEGGAIDQYLSFAIGAAFMMGGNEHPVAGEPAAEPGAAETKTDKETDGDTDAETKTETKTKTKKKPKTKAAPKSEDDDDASGGKDADGATGKGNAE